MSTEQGGETRKANKVRYSTYIFEFWLIFIKHGETKPQYLTAEEIEQLWKEAKFGNIARILGSFVWFMFTIPSYFAMKRAQRKARGTQ